MTVDGSWQLVLIVIGGVTFAQCGIVSSGAAGARPVTTRGAAVLVRQRVELVQGAQGARLHSLAVRLDEETSRAVACIEEKEIIIIIIVSIVFEYQFCL